MGHLTFRIGDHIISHDDPRLETLLASVHGTKQRPLCLCRDPGVEMYVAKINGRHVIKRMPNTGADHALSCDSYEPPAELSGLGPLIGSAIQENIQDGVTTLRFDFTLSKRGSRSTGTSSPRRESDSVRTDGNKLTLRGALHYLWEQAGFHRWSPAMAGKRAWHVIHKFLLQAAEDKAVKGMPLADVLYIPEPFSRDRMQDIAQRRMARLSQITPRDGSAGRLLLLIGEVKEIAPSRYGHKLMIKHLPDFPIMMDDGLHNRLRKRFANEFALWDAVDKAHLVVIGTFGVGPTGVASLDAAALMVANENWLPFEHLYEHALIDRLAQSGRCFTKGLRYSLSASQPLASVVLMDTQPIPIALYIVPPEAGEDYDAALDSLIVASQLGAWVWRAGGEAMPTIPPAL
jgi:hypothetical protein